MTDISFDLSGVDRIERRLEDLRDDWENSPRWVVGTAVEYSVYLEFGTSKMDPKPFFRPVIAEARVLGIERFIDRHTRKDADDIDTARELVRTLALAVERRVKETITKKGLIDTGTLRASVRAVRGGTISDLPDASEIDPDASSGVEVSA